MCVIDVSHRIKHSLEVVPSALVHRNVLSTGEILTKLRTLDRDISLDEAFLRGGTIGFGTSKCSIDPARCSQSRGILFISVDDACGCGSEVRRVKRDASTKHLTLSGKSFPYLKSVIRG
jgi:hypothetical protein